MGAPADSRREACPTADASAGAPAVMAAVPAFLALRGVVKRYGEITALAGVSLDIAEGEFVCFLGPSGCGKTTLLRAIAGLERLDAGTLTLGGRELSSVSARLRNFGIVFQSYSLFPNMTIARNVAYGLECRGWKRAQIAQRVEEMLELVGLPDQARKHPHQLSGGQQQRVALARALAPKPAVLLLDEPLSALDAKVRDELRGQIRDLQKALSITTVMVTHDQQEAMEVADRIVVMNAGRIAQVGDAVDLYERPGDAFVAGFLGRMNRMPPALANDWATGPGSFLGIRPEDVEVRPASDDAGPVRAHVEKCVFLGTCTRLTLRVGDARLVAELRGRRTDLPAGAVVSVHVPATAVHRLADPS